MSEQRAKATGPQRAWVWFWGVIGEVTFLLWVGGGIVVQYTKHWPVSAIVLASVSGFSYLMIVFAGVCQGGYRRGAEHQRDGKVVWVDDVA